MRQSPLPPSSAELYSPWYLRYLMFMAFLIVMVSLMDRYIVSILLEQIKEDLSLTDTQLGWLVGPAFVIVHVICELPIARVADRSVRKNMIAVAMGLWSLFTIAAGFAKNFPQLVVARMGVGITEAASGPPLAALLSDSFPVEKRGRAMAMLSVGGVAGIGCGILLGGYVGEAYGWRTALIVAGFPGVLLSMVVWRTVKEPPRGGSDPNNAPQTQKSFKDTLSTLFGMHSFRWLVIGVSLATVTSMGRGAWEPVFLMRVYELDQSQAGLVYFLIGPIPSMLGAFTGGLLVDRLVQRDRRWFLWFPALTTILTFPLMAGFLLWPVHDVLLTEALHTGFLFSILGSLVGSMSSPATISAAQTLAPASMRATAHALWTMVAGFVGMGVGPLAAGWMSESFTPVYGAESIRYSLVIISSIAVPAAICLYIGARNVRKDLGI